MMKKFKKAIVKTMALVLLATSVLPIFACGKEESLSSDRKVETSLTNEKLVDNGESEYQIVVPNRATRSDLFAAQELKTFVEEASGASLEIVSDYYVTFDEDAKYVSIGDTRLYRSSGMKVDHLLAKSQEAFMIKTYGNTAILKGVNERSNIYATYEFMHQLFDWETYALDETYVRKSPTIYWQEMEIVDYPDFVGRAAEDVSTKRLAGQDELKTRFRQNFKALLDTENFIGEAPWSNILRGHGSFHVLPPAKYLQAHPDWYGGVHHGEDDQQLCYSSLIDNKEGMFTTFIENLKVFIEAEPDAKWFNIGQEDYSTWCTCSKCKEYRAEYGGASGSAGGMLVVAMNKVAREIKSWLQEEHPERADEVMIVMFAYHMTLEAPLKTDGTPAVYADDNVGVRFAPLNECYSHAYNDPNCSINGRIPSHLKGWSKISKNIFVWTYSLFVFDNHLYTNDLYAIKSNLEYLKETGVMDVFYNGTNQSTVPFHELKTYVQSKLLWNTELDVYELVGDFMDKYYQEASDIVEQFYWEYLHHCLNVGEEENIHFRPIEFTKEKDLFDKKLLLNWLKLLDKGLEKANQIQDEARREKIYNRVLSETIGLRFLLIDLYGDEYDKVTIEKMIDSFATDAAICGFVTMKEEAQGTIDFKYAPAKVAAEWKGRYL